MVNRWITSFARGARFGLSDTLFWRRSSVFALFVAAGWTMASIALSFGGSSEEPAIKGTPHLVLFLSEGAQASEISALEQALGQLPAVADVSYVSASEAKARTALFLAENGVSGTDIGDEFFPASLEVRFVRGASELASLGRLTSRLSALAGIDEVVSLEPVAVEASAFQRWSVALASALGVFAFLFILLGQVACARTAQAAGRGGFLAGTRAAQGGLLGLLSGLVALAAVGILPAPLQMTEGASILIWATLVGIVVTCLAGRRDPH